MSSSRFKSGLYFTAPGTDNEQSTQLYQSSHFSLLSVSIDVKIESNIATTTITQKYTNLSSSPAEHTKYVFPVYDGSAVTSFRCWIGKDKLLEGAVKPKQQARKEFAEAVSEHRAAVLVEELTPEIFETNLGNIPSQTDVTVEITLATQLKGDQTTGATTLTIPTSVAPRYGDRPQGYAQPETTTTTAVAAEDALRINVHVSMPEPIKKIESQTHTISVELTSESNAFDPCKASASLTGREASLDKDFVLAILSNPKEWMVSRAIAVPQPDSNKSTIALTLNPGDLFRKKFNPEDFAGEVIFIADRSGSMLEEMSALRDVMSVFLRSLPSHCSFNVVSFGSRFSWLWEASQPYGQDTLDEATSHVRSFEANYGGTEILKALESIPDRFNKRTDVPTNVILLTDGETWDVEQVIEFVQKMTSNPEVNIRFFALGIGHQVSHRLIQGIGMRGGGCAEVISDTGSSLVWQGKTIQMLKNAVTPSGLQCSVSFDGLPVLQAPHSIPPLNGFSHLPIYYAVEKDIETLPETLTVMATTKDEMKLTAQLPIHKSNIQSIHHLAAKAFMNDYETGQSWLHEKHTSLRENDPDTFNSILENEAQELGVKWSIPGKWTSYVAVDRSTQEDHETSLEPAERDELHYLDSESEDDEDMPFVLFDGPPNISRGSGVARFCRTASSSSSEGTASASRMSHTRGEIPTQLGCFGGSVTGGGQGIPTTSGSRRSKCKRRSWRLSSSSTASDIAHPRDALSPPGLTLSNVLHLQAANGEMRVETTAIEEQILAEFQPHVTEKMNQLLVSLSVKLDTTKRAFLLSVLAVVYVTTKCQESKAMWEMQIDKARRYLRTRLEEAAVGIDPESLLEQLESMAATELIHQ